MLLFKNYFFHEDYMQFILDLNILISKIILQLIRMFRLLYIQYTAQEKKMYISDKWIYVFQLLIINY